MLVSSSLVRPNQVRVLPSSLVQEAPRAQNQPLRVASPYRAEPAHGSVADRARIAQRLLAFGAW